jgi:hypothetical protein
MSCNLSRNKDNALRFDSLQLTKTYYLRNDTTNPGCNLRISFVYPDSANKQTLTSLQKIFVEKVFGDSFKDLTPRQAIDNYSEQYVQTFKQVEIYSDDLPDLGDPVEESELHRDNTGFFYYSIIKDTVVYNQNNFISFTVETTVYEGGAHSSQAIYGYVVNLKTGQLLCEEDFSGINYAQNVARTLAAKIAKANDLENPADLENLGYYSTDDIVPNNNFTIDNNGITYYFNENEIAGTMVGLIQVFIPYEEINIYMRKNSPITSLSH